MHFNPRPPWGGRHIGAWISMIRQKFQSTPSVGRATQCVLNSSVDKTISIHALRGEGDYIKARARKPGQGFQSTPSVGRATPAHAGMMSAIAPFQSTPSVGRATSPNPYMSPAWTFQSTPSVGRATVKAIADFYGIPISIHALRGEGDSDTDSDSFPLTLFQSTPSVGRATTEMLEPFTIEAIFQSTPSVGRATMTAWKSWTATTISIHALRGEGDSKNIQICNIVFVHDAYKTVYFCDSCAFT